VEADKLKSMGGEQLKVIALGIGRGVSHRELVDISSGNPDDNVILVSNFTSLSSVAGHFRNFSCYGQW